ncbi:hypothetical protein [Lentilactobacillus sp. SPB1-3]|uniref:Uncharacterized protein n=1 Tax=Lentilactobacillus terminaliae TaxID=3003483 RepID=A0ACD5DD36_9LACO|nr:hypothetical protein [Lentilactobacillus sp. SPB1-3]MCZ0978061.1 hypothetical protein [Lentilactobacillus sp. SPB1-3]
MTNAVAEKLNYRDYQAIMQDELLEESRAVNAYLSRAKRFANHVKLMKKSFARMGMNDTLYKLVKQEDTKRAEMVWSAIETARLEKRQGWRLLEDGDAYVESLIAKYQGDLSQALPEESKRLELAELLETMEKRQSEGDWR